MSYTIYGDINDSARVLIINEGDWTIESNELYSPPYFEAQSLVSGTKTVIGRTNSGEVLAYGAIEPIFSPR